MKGSALPLLSLVLAFPLACDPRPDPKVLAELCEEHPTDKCEFHHGYVEAYDTLFDSVRGHVRRVLEIGVLKGHSLRMWAAYFPRAQIFGIDIVDSSEHDSERITTFVADQAAREELAVFIESHGADFDIIIDDGGHTMEQQQTSFGFLYPHLRPGGLYIIEDIHTSFPERYPGYGVNATGTNSTFTMIQHFMRDGEFESDYLSEAEEAGLSESVDYCFYLVRTTRYHSDFFLCRKKDEPASATSP